MYRNRTQIVEIGKRFPLDTCFTWRSGGDITLISWGAMLKETVEAADYLANYGIQADIIDVATLKPMDETTLLTSVQKTGHCVIIQEAPQTGGMGAEIAAVISEQVGSALRRPIKRVAGYDTIMPYAQLEHAYLPSTQRIVSAIEETLEL